MSGNHSRTKGAAAEREFARCIFDELGIKLVRNLEQSRRGGHDLIPLDGPHSPVALQIGRYAFECKRYSRVTPHLLRGWWAQTVAQAEDAGLVPCLCYRQDRMDWRVVLPLPAVRSDLPSGDGMDWTVELSVCGFASLVRELAQT